MRKKDTMLTKVAKTMLRFDKEFKIRTSLKHSIRLNAKQLDDLKEQVMLENRELEKVKKLAGHNKAIYEGLEELKTLTTYPLEKAENQAMQILKDEIGRLEELLSEYRERITKDGITNPLHSLSQPKLMWSFSPN